MTNNVWKYCAIRAQIDGSIKKLKFFDADGNHKVTDIKDPHLEIAKLGQDGWEMVTLTEITNPNSRVYYFKKHFD